MDELSTFQDDGIWLISCSFSIWTMVSGFGLLESGRVSSKDEVNIMVKNIVDVVFGGLSYWMFGYGFSFGNWYPNAFIGLGDFFYNPELEARPVDQAMQYARFFLRMSFATTTSTIVSAAMAERIRLKPYIVITFLMTIVHSICAHWVWSRDGFLNKLGCVDAAGCSVIHLVGGLGGLAATIYLKPRQARFGERGNAHMSNPTNALLGTFMLWWGWMAFNTSTTFGVVRGRWRLAARAAMATLLSSLGGGCTSIVISLITTRKCQIDLLIDGLLASLVSMTAGCHSTSPRDSIAIGSIGSALALAVIPFIERLEIDDPVGVIPVHVVGAVWGMVAVGLFSREDPLMFANNMSLTGGKDGLLYSWDFDLLLIQSLAIGCISVFSLVITFISLATMNQFPWGLRMTKYEEQLGANLIEHGLAGHNIAKYSIEKKLNVNVIKYVAKWKRIARKARERKAAEAAARGEVPEQDRPSQQHQSQGSLVHRLAPLKLNGLRPKANGTGTLSARPRSGRVPIENDKNSLPPMHSSRRVPYPLAHADTAIDLREALAMANDIGNGSLPNGLHQPITIVTAPPSSPAETTVAGLGESRFADAENSGRGGGEGDDDNSSAGSTPNSGRRNIPSRLKGRNNARVTPQV